MNGYDLFNQLPKKWKELILPHISQEHIDHINNSYANDVLNNKVILPPYHQIFKAFKMLNPEDIKVVILGQDPYHGKYEAHGLAFSVNQRFGYIPPSLVNIFKEQIEDVGKVMPENGNLDYWAKQGVFLLNSSLTVEMNQANSNLKYNWSYFTDVVIELLAVNYEHLVFMLWGNNAKLKAKYLTSDETTKVKDNLILKAVHPSPLSANRGGWFGCKHFSKANEYLKEHNKSEIKW